MTALVQTRARPVLKFLLILCATAATIFPSNSVVGGDQIVVELKSGRKIRADSIAYDVRSEHITAKLGNNRVQLQRRFVWNEIGCINASAEQIAGVRIPAEVLVIDDPDERVRPPEARLTPRPLEAGISYVPRIDSRSALQVSPNMASYGGCEFAPQGCCHVPYDPGLVVGVRNFFPER